MSLQNASYRRGPSGLPIIYKNSGALPEYCNNYGVSFNDMDFVPALKEMMIKYDFINPI